MKQHIIHIGFPKAGSTFIQKYAYEHPKIEFNFKDFYDFRFSGNIDLSIKDEKQR